MTVRSVALLVPGAVALLAGLWSGLARIGWAWPGSGAVPLDLHGPLFVCGFLGTVIALERAVALDRPWAYAAPLLTGAGAVALLVGPPVRLGAAAMAGGAAVLTLVFGGLLRRHRPAFLWVMAAGALAWAVATAAWAAGAGVPDVVLGWTAFLVFTIVGERLELSRVVPQSVWVARSVLALLGVLGLGVLAAALGLGDAGTRTAGAALVGLAAVLATGDVARHTIRRRGLTRFMAACLLGGYAWLAVGGAVFVSVGDVAAGPLYDAALHAVFLGFVASMVFAHAPVILPSVIDVRVRYRPALYLPLGLLHASLALRLAGDVAPDARLRRWGGLLSALALLLYALVAAIGRFGRRELPNA